MKTLVIKINILFKGIILLMRPHLYLGWLRHPFLMASNTLSLSQWISIQDKHDILDDFYTPTRDYARRFKLYEFISRKFNLNSDPIDYIEFGVSEAHSFRWWVAHNMNENTLFHGFDTFEGLPEKWGTFEKGAMAANIPDINDQRVSFYPGLFQDTLPNFLKQIQKIDKRKVIHMDADLFSSTLYTLTSLAPFLNKGDIIIFDEFSVPNHEFMALKMFTDSYYIKTRLLAAVNNYYCIAIIIE